MLVLEGGGDESSPEFEEVEEDERGGEGGDQAEGKTTGSGSDL